jgi:hypothetical protein
MTNDLDILKYIKEVNGFLYKYIFLNIIINIFLYYTSNENLTIISYILIELYFFANYKIFFKKPLFALISQIFVISLINLTYLTFILTALFNHFVFDAPISILLINFFYCDLDTYILANLYLLFFTLSVLLFNRVIPTSKIIATIKKIDLINFSFQQSKIFYLLLMCISFELFFYVTGLIGTQLSGGFIVEDDHVTWYTSIYNFVNFFHIFLNILLLKNKKEMSFGYKIFLLISFILSFISFGFSLRRNIIVYFILNFILYFVIGNNKKIHPLKIFFSTLIGIFIMVQSFTFLTTVRSSGLIDSNKSLIEIIREGQVLPSLSDDNISGYGSSVLKENLSFRMLNNHELATLFYYKSDNKNQFLKGKLFLTEIIKTIPSIMLPSKDNFEGGESLITQITDSPLYYIDTVDSLQTSSYADFGLFGLVIYPIVINLLFLIIYIVITYKRTLNLTAIYILTILIPYISIRIIEINLSIYMVLIRDLILFILFFNLLLSSTIEKKL